MSWIKYLEKKCEMCDKIFEYDSRQKSKYCSQNCRSNAYNQKKKNNIGEDGIVICQICNRSFKEINKSHLKLHNISSLEYDSIYGENKRTSKNTKLNKNTLSSKMSPEFSEKLSKSHTIDNYIRKYGVKEGKIKFDKMIENKTYKNSIKSYIDKYGYDNGVIEFSKVQRKKATTIENQINKYGEDEGMKRYEMWINKQKNKNYLSYYVDKYGYDIGLKMWLEKNKKISISNSKVPEDKKNSFLLYIIEVNKYTRISLNENKLENIELRGNNNGYDLDHIVSKIDGFKNDIPPYIIGHISNLKIVESSYNRKKQHKSDLDISVIINEYQNDIDYKNLVNNIQNINYI